MPKSTDKAARCCHDAIFQSIDQLFDGRLRSTTATAGHHGAEQEPEPKAFQQADKMEELSELMQQVRDLGRYPKESKRVVVERQLAEKLRRAQRAKLSRGQLSVGSRRKQWACPWGRSPPTGTHPSAVKLCFKKASSDVRAAFMSKSKEPRRNGAMRTFTYYDVLPTSHEGVTGHILQRSQTSIWPI